MRGDVETSGLKLMAASAKRRGTDRAHGPTTHDLSIALGRQHHPGGIRTKASAAKDWDERRDEQIVDRCARAAQDFVR
jgi:hypothetical protein